MQRTRVILRVTLILLVLTLSAPIAAQKRAKQEEKEKAANLPAVIWHDPGGVETLDLLYGAGGREHAPEPHGKYTFLKEDLKKTSPKFDVEDEQGVRWRVKLGQEPQAETAATRMLWAAGYFVDEDYYLTEFKVTGLPKLHRGQSFVSADGTVHRARLKRRSKEVKKLGDWDWFDNPFLGTKELNGLRVMMSSLNNWDLDRTNNSIYEVDGERHYLVSDVGASFGRTGNSLTRSKSVLKYYANSKFIEKVTPDYVDFVMHSRPFFLTVFHVPNYHKRTQMEQITKHIPRTDAKWLGKRLAQLSEEQIRDCFRAAGYASEEIEGYTKAVERRIAELNAL
jgi:hypothetical protein